MTPADVLRKAKEHISTPEMWLKGNYCRGYQPEEFIPDEAPCCSYGAVAWAMDVAAESQITRPIDQILHYAMIRKKWNGVRFYGLPAFNDHPETTHADIMKLFDDAIALAEAGQ